MDRITRLILNLIFCIQVLLLFLLFVQDRIHLPAFLQVAGRMHPLILHLPIGIMIFMIVLLLVQKQFDKESTRQVIHIGLLLTSFSASLAALFGFFLSLQGEYGGDAMMRHKVSGVLLSFLCYGVLLWHYAGKKRSVFFTLGGASFLVLIITGHTGSVLTHGENFLFEPLGGPKVVLTAENASVYHFAIEPILERKCFSCHNDAKAKGKLIMTSPEAFKKGGENGQPWVDGKPMESRMIKAFYLPLSHDEHMPPDGKPQLTKLEVSALESWIKSGADFEKKLAQFSDGDSLKLVVSSLALSEPAVEAVREYSFSAVSDDVLKKMNTPFRTVSPLYQNSPALQADFYVRKAFELKSLEELKAIQDQLVVLNLSKMPVTDKELNIIGSFKNLESLNLNFSAIQGTGLPALKSLKNLTLLSLSGTAVEAKQLSDVLALPKLGELYVWSTRINDSQIDSLSKKYPSVKIFASGFKDESILKLSKPILVNEGVIRKGEKLILKHPMPGVTIHYTIDGTDPDTVKGQVYGEPLAFKETAVVKARACKTGWYCSDAVEVIGFVEGIKPQHIELLNAPDPQYPGEGVQSLTDGRKGVTDVLKEPSWLAYRNQPFSVGFSFGGKAPELNKIVLSYGRNLGAYSFPPQEVEVWAGANKDQLKLIKKIVTEMPKENGPTKVDVFPIVLEPAAYSYYKVIATPVAKLPSWHGGKGEKGWVFIDEMFFY